MKAKELLYKKRIMGHIILEMVIWELPSKNQERPHGLKYQLHYGDDHGNCLVRYDNETGKGDHRHYGNIEELYKFTTVDQLLLDFFYDIKQINRKKKCEKT